MSVKIQPTESTLNRKILFVCFFSSMSRCLLLASLLHPKILLHLFIFQYSSGQKKPIEAFSKISQNSQEYTYVGVSFLIMLQACNFTKKETPRQCFPVNLAKFLEYLRMTASAFQHSLYC